MATSTSQPASCAQKGCGCLLLVLLAGFALYSCDKREHARRAALTPEQRAAEDKAIADQKAADDRERTLDNNKCEAESVCKDCVRQFLKYPDDASFPWGGAEISTNADGDVFACEGKAKAKNAFGAELTYRWEAIVFLDDHTWKLAMLVIDGKTVIDHADLSAAIKAKHSRAAQHTAKSKQPSLIWRTWTDKSGKHETEAALVGREDNAVVLRKPNGKEITVPIENLSDEDREWLRKNGL